MGKTRFLMLLPAAVAILAATCGCQGEKPRSPVNVAIRDGDPEPADWGKAYPVEYELWKKTAEPKKAGSSRYKRGWDTDLIIYDKLSEFPYMGVLFNGWGFGIEYNEPRGHHYMISDQLDVDHSRLKAGGVCLTCKTPYASALKKEMGADYFSKPFMEVHAKIPKDHAKLGVMCNDCHDPKTMENRIDRWTLKEALEETGKDPATLTHQELRSAVCAQCHVTYVIPKDGAMKSVGLFFPWDGGKFGKTSVETIIKKIRSSDSYREWTQKVTGLKLGFIRHPEFELFSNGSVHWNASVACADCHMPYKRVGHYKVSDHDVTSPLKNDLRGCVQCHSEGVEWLKSQVYAIQDRTMSGMLRAGYQAAFAAKLIEKINETGGPGGPEDSSIYKRMIGNYEEAFYRVVFIGAENSIGFHNPSEAGRILADALAFGGEAERLAAVLLTRRGVNMDEVNTNATAYLNSRGDKHLEFRPAQELKDPSGLAPQFPGGR